MDEVTREPVPGSVGVRLRGPDPDFVVTLPQTGGGASVEPAGPAESLKVPADGDEGGTARGNLRLPAHLQARAEGSVTATAAHGTLLASEVSRGDVQLETPYGAIGVGVRQGTAAWLDVSSRSGRVRDALTESQAPGGAEGTVKIHARTHHGNVDIRRAKR